jgi:hypothetical protein
MQKEINFYQEMASENRLQENGRSPVPLCRTLPPLKRQFKGGGREGCTVKNYLDRKLF